MGLDGIIRDVREKVERVINLATQANNPIPGQTIVNTPPPATAAAASVHGPYEDAIIAACALAEAVLASEPVDVKQALWKDHVVILNGLIALANRVDFLHLFQPTATQPAAVAEKA
jgi:hypothetical protein